MNNFDKLNLCVPFTNIRDLRDSINKNLKKLDFDPAMNCIRPEELYSNPVNSLKLRAEILLNVYKGEYHTDSFNYERLSRNILNNKENIWFWGVAEEIEKARFILSKSSINEVDCRELCLGTVTMLSVENEYGIGYKELCRSGSTDISLGAKAFILYRTLDYINDNGKNSYYSNHTQVLVPRNRKSTSTIRGGEAVNKIHSKYARSRFWGFSPWYLMQGNNIEILDFRECNKNPEHVKMAIESSDTWLFVNENEALFCKTLSELNFGIAPKIEVLNGYKINNKLGNRANLIMPEDEKLINANHITIAVDNKGKYEFDDALKNCEKASPCCLVVKLDLTDTNNLNVQKILIEKGYRLTNITPPKIIYNYTSRGTREIKINPFGYWSKPRKSEKLILPHYYKNPANDLESIIFEYLINYMCADFNNPILEF